jgi:hypothetical protein
MQAPKIFFDRQIFAFVASRSIQSAPRNYRLHDPECESCGARITHIF